MTQELATQYEALVEQAGDGIVRCDPQGRIRYANPRTRQLLDVDGSALVGLSLPDKAHPEDREPLLQHLSNAQVDGSDSLLKFRIITRSGDARFIEAKVSLLRSDAGDGERLAILRDVTARHLAELDQEAQQEQLRRRLEQDTEQLIRSEEQFRGIFDCLLDGVLLADTETRRFVTGNRAICELLGYSLEELRQLGVQDLHPPDALEDVIAAFEKQSRGEIKLAEALPVIRKDGSVFYADIHSSPFSFNGREHLIGSFRDVTQRLELEWQNLESQDAVNREMQRHKEYVSEAAHQLRNPVQVLSGNIELFEESNLTPKQRKMLDTVRRNCARLMTGIKDLT